jgi:hypothetical protein
MSGQQMAPMPGQAMMAPMPGQAMAPMQVAPMQQMQTQQTSVTVSIPTAPECMCALISHFPPISCLRVYCAAYHALINGDQCG